MVNLWAVSVWIYLKHSIACPTLDNCKLYANGVSESAYKLIASA